MFEKILIVELSKTSRTLVRNVLNSHGYEVLIAQNPEEAWEILNTESNRQTPIDLVVTELVFIEDQDIQTPDFELVKKIRSNPDEKINNLPIVVLTQLKDHKSMQSAMDEGVNFYLKKNCFDESNFFQVIFKLV